MSGVSLLDGRRLYENPSGSSIRETPEGDGCCSLDKEQMAAIRIHEFGGREVIGLESVARPEPAAGEVLLRVAGAGVNPIDWLTRMDRGGPVDVDLPWIPGWDVSGTVEKAGPEVEQFEVGDEVFGLVRFPEAGNTYAEYVTAPSDELAKKPEDLDIADASGVPLVALTVWQALVESDLLRDGTRILIHAAAGGVGHIAVQLAAWRGAHVIGTASPRNRGFLRELGAARVVDYRETRFEEAVEDVDVVLDAIGGETQRRSFEVLRDSGTLVTLKGFEGERSSRLAARHGVETRCGLVRPSGAQLGRVAELIEEDTLRVEIAETLPLEEAARAHERSEGGHVRGKIVLIP